LNQATKAIVQSGNFIWSSNTYADIPKSSVPEVAFLGRTNVGKSTLLRGILGQDIVRASKKRNSTKSINAFQICGNDKFKTMTLIDTPGYGFSASEKVGSEILEYLTRRPNLRRVFLLADISHGFKDTDKAIANLFLRRSIPWQLVWVKLDNMKGGNKTLEERFEDGFKLVNANPNGFREIIACSALKNPKQGLEDLRFAILRAGGLMQDDYKYCSSRKSE
ncbi:putative GTP-binding protein EngB, partial [Neolecta irregularis DAH-3]